MAHCPLLTSGLLLAFLGLPAIAQDEPAEAPADLPVDPQQAQAIDPPPGDDSDKPPEMADLSHEEVVALLDDSSFATRRQAEDHLLTDDTLTFASIKPLIQSAESDEQRYRLLRVAEHHVMREVREQEFGNGAAPPQPFENQLRIPNNAAAIGFSYEAVPAGDNPIETLQGVTVVATMPGFPGYAYLRTGDIIIAIDGDPAANRPRHQDVTAWISWRISTHRAGDPISFTIIREGRAKTINLHCAQASALSAMYTTDGNKAASRSARYEAIWQASRDKLVQGLPKPKRLAPAQ